MNVAIINTFDISGGASRAAYNLYSNLRMIGVDAQYLVKEKKLNDENIIHAKYDESLLYTANRILIQNKIKEYRTNLSNSLFQIDYINSKQFPYKLFEKYNILNLHWIASFLSPSIINELSQDKHLVWTLHDQASMTGGCHYTSGCEGYKNDCSNCLQSSFPKGKDYPKLFFEDKIKYLSNIPITFVVASKWMKECLKESRLYSKHRIEYIPYSIDTQAIFKPLDKVKSKNRLNIPLDKITILFAADNGNEYRKGFYLLIEAFKILKNIDMIKNLLIQEKIQLISLGNIHPEISKMGIPYISIDRIEDNLKLNDFYNSGDLLILPSIEDNLPLTMLESISAGTPVVAFPIGGMKDVIQSGINGELALNIDGISLANAIYNLIKSKLSKNINFCQESVSSFALLNYSNPKEALLYKELYIDLSKIKNTIYSFDIESSLNKYNKKFFIEFIIILVKVMVKECILILRKIRNN